MTPTSLPAAGGNRKKLYLFGTLTLLVTLVLHGSIQALEKQNLISGNILENIAEESTLSQSEVENIVPDTTPEAPQQGPAPSLSPDEKNEDQAAIAEPKREENTQITVESDGTQDTALENRAVEEKPQEEKKANSSVDKEKEKKENNDQIQKKQVEEITPDEIEATEEGQEKKIETKEKQSAREKRNAKKAKEEKEEKENQNREENVENVENTENVEIRIPEKEIARDHPTGEPSQKEEIAIPVVSQNIPSSPDSFLPPGWGEEELVKKEKATENVEDLTQTEKIAHCSKLEGRMLLFTQDSIVEDAVQMTHEVDEASCPSFCRSEIFFDLHPEKRSEGKCRRAKSGCDGGGDDGVKFRTQKSCESYYEEKVILGAFGTPKEKIDLERIKKEIREKYRNIKNACLINGVTECLAKKDHRGNENKQCLETYILPCFDWDSYIETVLSSYSFKALQKIGNEVLEWKEDNLKTPNSQKN